MRLTFRSAILGMALALVAGQAMAQSSASLSTTGSAQIIQPITLSKGKDLQFGVLVRPAAGNTGGTVTINADGSRSFGTGNSLAGLSTPAPSAATFTVGGEPSHSYKINVPASMTMTGGANTITVTLTAYNKNGVAITNSSGTLDTNGADNFSVGGSFALSSATPTGSYTGTFNTQVSYE